MGQAQSDRGAPPELASPVRPKFFNANGAVRNPYRATLEEMKDVQLEQLQQFRDLAAAGQWEQIHRQHFDWYMWPVEDGSQSQYNVLAEDVAELLADDDWVDRYHESLALVSAAWGWDVVGARPVEPLQPGQGWTDWDIRLAKMIRSLWLFGQAKERESLQTFARMLRPQGGLRYGHIDLDGVFLME
jgi:hypothetical protein